MILYEDLHHLTLKLHLHEFEHWTEYQFSWMYYASYHTTKCKLVTLKSKVFSWCLNLLKKINSWNAKICNIVFSVITVVIRLTWVPGLSITVWSGTTIRAMWLKYLHSSCRQSLWWTWHCVLRVIKYMHIGLFSRHAAPIFRYVDQHWYFWWTWLPQSYIY